MDLQLNITVPKPKPPKPKKSAEYSFVSKPVLAGKTFARKRQDTSNPEKGILKFSKESPREDGVHKSTPANSGTQETYAKFKETNKFAKKDNFIDDNKRIKHKDKFKDLDTIPKNIQKPKQRSGGWISSLFKNNPSVPRIGQRAVKPLVEKVFSGKTFSDLKIHSHSVANLLQNLGLKELTTVQQKASPIILEGRDVLVRSQTGSGKTLAYALPIVEAMQAIRPKITRHDGIRVLVIVPTRELAVQTYELFIKLVKPFTWVVPGLLSGGQKRKAEKARLRKGMNILVGTPGRICDHLRHTQSLNFAQTRCLVLDEADCLLDMGYEKDVASIVKSLDDHKLNSTYDPMALMKQTVNKKTTFEDDETENKADEKVNEEGVKEGGVETNSGSNASHHLTEVFHSDRRQTVLLSATLTKAVEKLAGLTMVEPVFVDTSEGRTPLIADSLQSKPTFLVKPPDSVTTDEVKVESGDEDSDEDVGSNDEEETKEEVEEEIKEVKEGVKEKGKEEAKKETESGDDEEQSYCGLKPFSGKIFADLFASDTSSPKSVKKPNPTSPKTPPKEPPKPETPAEPETENPKLTSESDSDSDSDYEYYKVQKKLVKKAGDQKKVENVVEFDEPSASESDEEVSETETQETVSEKGASKSEISFKDALRTAIDEEEFMLPETVKQSFIITPMKLRLVTLCALVVEHCVVKSNSGKMIVFMATQDMVDYHCDLLQAVLTGVAGRKKIIVAKKSKKKKMRKKDSGVKEDGDEEENEASSSESESGEQTQASSDLETELTDSVKIVPVQLEFFKLYGSMAHEDRIDVFKEFRQAKSGVLFCTDVAARGLDLPKVDLVFQYCAPSSATDYVHRVGRTGRAARAGAATLLLLPSEAEFVRHLEEKRIRLHQADDQPALESLRALVPGMHAHRAAIALQARLEDIVARNKKWMAQACRAYTSWVRFYSGYPRPVRPYLDSGELHLGHASKAFALRETPGQVARRVKDDPVLEERNNELRNRLTVDDNGERIKRKLTKSGGVGAFKKPRSKRQVISEYDSGLPTPAKKKKKSSN